MVRRALIGKCLLHWRQGLLPPCLHRTLEEIKSIKHLFLRRLVIKLLGIRRHDNPRSSVPGIRMVITPYRLAQDAVLLYEMSEWSLDSGMEDGALVDIEVGLHPFGHMKRYILDHKLYLVVQRASIRSVHLHCPCECSQWKNLWNLITRGQSPHTPNHKPESVRLSDGVL